MQAEAFSSRKRLTNEERVIECTYELEERQVWIFENKGEVGLEAAIL
jgi:hypothetical protein